MARKKIWAYAYKGDKEYIWNKDLGKEKLYYIWEALKIRREDPREFNSLTFMSTQSNKNKRAELTAVKNPKTAFFRYKSESVATGQSQDPDAEYISHEMAILVLSEMKVINFQQGETVLKIEFDHIKKDDLKIRFEDGTIYYPDLIGFFSKPEELAKQWGGKVAIEVKVTHPCSSQKIKDFKDHNIPVIEVPISEKFRLKAEFSHSDIDESTMEQYYQLLQRRFANIVYMKILSNPTMPVVYSTLLSSAHNKMQHLKDQMLQQKDTFESVVKENESFKLKIRLFEQNLPKIKKLISDKTAENESIKADVNKKQQIISQLNEKITELEAKNYEQLGFLARLRRLF